MANNTKYFHHVEHRKFQNHSKFTLWLSLVITLIFTIVEFAGGIYANSLALLSDSFHMLSDVLALGLSMVAIYFASKPPTKNYTYGFLRLEIIVAFLNGLALIVISLGITYEGVMRIIHPEPVESGVMVVIATLGLLVNIILTLILVRSLKKRRRYQYSECAMALHGGFVKFSWCYCGCSINSFYRLGNHRSNH